MGPSPSSALAVADLSDEQLLKELNGTLAEQGYVGPPPEQTAPLSDRLETSDNPIPTPRAKIADKQHAKAAGGFGYKVILEGEYYSASKETKGHIIKQYELAFNLPALTNNKGEAALGIIIGASKPGGGLLIAALKKMDPFAKAVRTHKIKSVTPLSTANPIPTSLQYMNFEALAEFVRAHPKEIPLDPADYWDAEHLREDIIYLRTNTADNVDPKTGQKLSEGLKDGKGFGAKRSPLEIVQERHAERQDQKALFDMNPEL